MNDHTDPLLRSQQPAGPLFAPREGENATLNAQSWKDTSTLAGERAALAVGSRRAAILKLIESQGPLAIFEIAERLGLFDHQISGRFGELERDGLLVKIGERRVKPGTQCQAEVYGLRPVSVEVELIDRAASPGFKQAAIQLRGCHERYHYPHTRI